MNYPTPVYSRAVDALNAGRFQEALRLASGLGLQLPRHAGVHFVAGVSALHLNQVPLAVRSLRLAAELNPTRPDYRAQLARALAAANLMRDALAEADAAAALPDPDPLTLDTLGVVYTQGNAHARALDMFRRAAERGPDSPNRHFNLATSLMFFGRLDEAEQEYEACLRLAPTFWKAHLALSQLRRQGEGDNHLERLDALRAQWPDEPAAQMYLGLAMAKEYEDLGDYPRSFDHLAQGKAAGAAMRRGYTIARDEALFRAIEEAFPVPLDVPPSQEVDEPIFVVGMPRSGTTLVDRILSSHPDVHSAGELRNFGVALKHASGSRTPQLLDVDTVARAAHASLEGLGRTYIESTRPGTGHTPRFVDKLPHNFLYAGFIARALPNARIVCLRRSPMDTCLSNFRQLFALGSPYYDYSFDVLDTARYFVLFDRLTRHWRQILPGRVLELGYEELVDAQHESTRQLLEFCGLPWDERCLSFESNAAPVATASATQVRKPMFRSSMDRWRRYEPQLAQAREILEAAGIAI